MPFTQSDSNQSRIIKNVLHFMQSQDRNGTWLESLEEIQDVNSLITFDSEYVKRVLTEWNNDSNDTRYTAYINDLLSM